MAVRPVPTDPDAAHLGTDEDTDELPVLPAHDAGESDDETAAAPLGFLGLGLIHPASILVAAVFGGGLAYAFDDSSRLAVTAVAVVQGVLIVSWVLTSRVPGRIGAIVLGAGAAGGADAVVTHGHNELGPLVAVLGLSVVGLFAHQLLRAGHRVLVVESLAHIALLLVATVALAATLELRHQVDGPALATAALLTATAALVAGHLIDWIWSPLRFDPAVRRGLPAVVAAVIAGAVVGVIRLRHTVEFTDQRAALLGGALALVTAVFAVGAAFISFGEAEAEGKAETEAATEAANDESESSRRVRITQALRPVSATLFTLALMSPLAYLLCLALRG